MLDRGSRNRSARKAFAGVAVTLLATTATMAFADVAGAAVGSPGTVCDGMGAYDCKHSALDALDTVGTTGNKATDKRIADAEAKIRASTEQTAWDTPEYPGDDQANRVFELEKQAANALGGIKNPPAAVGDAIDHLVAGDELIAQTRIDMSAGGDAKKLAAAQKEMDKASAETAKGHFAAAIEHYNNAWKQALKA